MSVYLVLNFRLIRCQVCLNVIRYSITFCKLYHALCKRCSSSENKCKLCCFSTVKYITDDCKQKNTICYFKYCPWQGNEDELCDHYQQIHSHHTFEIKEGQAIIDFKVINKHTTFFSLVGDCGLYWLKIYFDKNIIKGVIVTIGNSSIMKYYFGLNKQHDGCHITVPAGVYKGQLSDETYDIRQSTVVTFYKAANAVSCHLDKRERVFKQKHLVMCNICFDLVGGIVRFCERKHYFCHSCIQRYWVLCGKVSLCPVCSGKFQYDCKLKICSKI